MRATAAPACLSAVAHPFSHFVLFRFRSLALRTDSVLAMVSPIGETVATT
jgi:hypothetical protein